MMRFRGLGDSSGVVTTINLDPTTGAPAAITPSAVSSGCVGTVEQCGLENLPVGSVLDPISNLQLQVGATDCSQWTSIFNSQCTAAAPYIIGGLAFVSLLTLLAIGGRR